MYAEWHCHPIIPREYAPDDLLSRLYLGLAHGDIFSDNITDGAGQLPHLELEFFRVFLFGVCSFI
jgi:hypothetical protein